MYIHTELDTDDANDELSRLQKGFDGELTRRYDAAARQIFERAQAEIHVETGALKSTGRFKANPGKTRFRAQIRYGGTPSGGPYLYANGKPDPSKNPVKYAFIEYSRAGNRRIAPGTPHNWLRFVESDWQAFEDATLDWFKGRRQKKFKKNKGNARRRRR